MKITIVGRKVTVRDKTKNIIEKKLTRLNKFFSGEASAVVTISQTRQNVNVEVTVTDKGMLFRGERSGRNETCCIDEIIDILIRQIRKNKTRLEKRLYEGVTMQFDNEYIDEEDYNVIKTKTVFLKPMDVEEAILQMNMLGHTFFLFIDAASEKPCVVYKRLDGDYAVLEPENL